MHFNDSSITICEELTDFVVMIWYDDNWLHTFPTLVNSCNLNIRLILKFRSISDFVCCVIFNRINIYKSQVLLLQLGFLVFLIY